MKILHYSLGLPGFRSGGLTKYSIDLMNEQVKVGEEVYLLYPGRFNIGSKTYIKKNKKYNGINIYEIINPLPVPLIFGVKDPKKYYTNIEEKYFKLWMEKEKFDILHIHTLMGLPLEFVKVVKDMGIKIIYTTHDYFGICPKVNLVRKDGNICTCNNDYNNCYICCKNGLSYKKIKIMQSKIYRDIKSSEYGEKIIKSVKKKAIVQEEKIEKDITETISTSLLNEYSKLNEYYKEIFKLINLYHFNSSIAKDIFENYLGDINGEVITITHSNIKDNRILRDYNKNKLNIVFLGSREKHKGLDTLINALKKIDSKYSWKLDVWGVEGYSNSKNIEFKGRYNYKQLDNVLLESDLLVVPSIWYETFGFIALEAYSYGLPIITTELVGFNDIIKNDITGFIVEPNEDSLKDKIIYLLDDFNKLKEVNENILEDNIEFDIRKHTLNMINFYRKEID